jgi:hypothetical protein
MMHQIRDSKLLEEKGSRNQGKVTTCYPPEMHKESIPSRLTLPQTYSNTLPLKITKKWLLLIAIARVILDAGAMLIFSVLFQIDLCLRFPAGE